MYQPGDETHPLTVCPPAYGVYEAGHEGLPPHQVGTWQGWGTRVPGSHSQGQPPPPALWAKWQGWAGRRPVGGLGVPRTGQEGGKDWEG